MKIVNCTQIYEKGTLYPIALPLHRISSSHIFKYAEVANFCMMGFYNIILVKFSEDGGGRKIV